ncbi:MAG: hypothetical protein GF320_15665 [Armatimonadia bacterium]|nr:hypothetical protein [Armatimonadia bacterium]
MALRAPKWLCCVAGLLATTPALAQIDTIALTPTGPTHSLAVQEVERGAYRLTIDGPDPWVVLEGAPADVNNELLHVISFEYIRPQGLDHFSVYFGPPMGNNTVATRGPVEPATDWTPFAIDLARTPTWSQDIHQFRLDPGDGDGEVLIRSLVLRAMTESEARAAEEERRAAEMQRQRLIEGIAEHMVSPANIEIGRDMMAASHDLSSDGSATAVAVVGRELDLVTLVAEASADVPPPVPLGPGIVAGQGPSPANRTVIRVFNRYGLAETQFLAYPPEVQGGVAVEMLTTADGDALIVAAPLLDESVAALRVFTRHGNLVREIAIDAVPAPFAITTGRLLDGEEELIFVAPSAARAGDVPYAVYSAGGDLVSRGSVALPEATSLVASALSTGTGHDEAVLTSPSGVAYRIDVEEGEVEDAPVSPGEPVSGLYPSSHYQGVLTMPGERFSVVVPVGEGGGAEAIDVGARENLFWFTPSGPFAEAGEGEYTRHAGFKHLRLDFASPVVDNPDFSRTDPDYWAGEAMMPTIRAMVADYDGEMPICWEPCFTHRWFYDRARRWAEAIDPATDLPAYVLLDRENRVGTYGEFGQTNAFVTGSYAPGVDPIESLYTYPQRAFLHELVRKFRASPEHFVVVEPNHEMEINAESPETHGDYNPNMIRAFYRYLISLYGDLETVNQVFGTEFTDEALDAPRGLDRGPWDEYSSENPYYMAWMRFMDYVIYRVVAGTYREALLAGFPPEAIKCHQIPDLYAISSLTAFSEPAQRVTPIDWMLSSGVGYGFTRYGIWFNREHNVVQGAHSSGFDSMIVGEYHSLVPDVDLSLRQLEYMRDNGIQFIHCMVWPEGHDRGFNAALAQALGELVERDQPRPGVTGGTGQVRPVAQGDESYDLVSLGTTEDHTGLIKSINADGSWEGSVYLVPFRAHVDVTPLARVDSATLSGEPVSLGPLTRVAAGNLVEVSLMARSDEPTQALELRLYHRGIELPVHRLRVAVTDEWRHLRLLVRIQVEMDEVRLELGPRDDQWLGGQVQVRDLLALRHTERTTRLEHGVFEGQRHAGGVTFDVLPAE